MLFALKGDLKCYQLKLAFLWGRARISLVTLS